MIDISNADTLPEYIIQATNDSVDKLRIKSIVSESILKNNEELSKLSNENERVEKLMLVYMKNVKRNTFEQNDKIVREINFKDIYDAINALRMTGENDCLNILFPTTGITEPVKSIGVYSFSEIPIPIFLNEISVNVIGKICNIIITTEYYNPENFEIEVNYKMKMGKFDSIYDFEIKCGIFHQKLITKEEENYEISGTFVSPDFVIQPKKCFKIIVKFTSELDYIRENKFKYSIPSYFLPKLKMVEGKESKSSIKIRVKTKCDEIQFPSGKKQGEQSFEIVNPDCLKKCELLMSITKEDQVFIQKNEGKFHYHHLVHSSNCKTSKLKDVIIHVMVDNSCSMNAYKDNVFKALNKIMSTLEEVKEIMNPLCSNCYFRRFGNLCYNRSCQIGKNGRTYFNEWCERLTFIEGSQFFRAVEDLHYGGSKENRVAIVLTDGNLSDPKSILRSIGKNIERLQFFVIGFGSACNYTFVRNLCTMTKGHYEFFDPLGDSSIEDIVEKQVKRIITKTEVKLPYENIRLTPFAEGSEEFASVFANSSEDEKREHQNDKVIQLFSKNQVLLSERRDQIVPFAKRFNLKTVFTQYGLTQPEKELEKL